MAKLILLILLFSYLGCGGRNYDQDLFVVKPISQSVSLRLNRTTVNEDLHFTMSSLKFSDKHFRIDLNTKEIFLMDPLESLVGRMECEDISSFCTIDSLEIGDIKFDDEVQNNVLVLIRLTELKASCWSFDSETICESLNLSGGSGLLLGYQTPEYSDYIQMASVDFVDSQEPMTIISPSGGVISLNVSSIVHGGEEYIFSEVRVSSFGFVPETGHGYFSIDLNLASKTESVEVNLHLRHGDTF